ncbi:gamma-glutamylaminecyclotransferase C-like [Glandiceps talaboti]
MSLVRTVCTMPKLHRVFVYGTLKKGQPNYHVITNADKGEATFVGKATTVETWPLIIATQYNIPFILDKAGHGNKIQGELYDLDDKKFESFDELERHPTWYCREHIQVELIGAGDGADKREDAWCYLLKDFNEEFLNLPMISDYDSSQHKTVQREDRVKEKLSEDEMIAAMVTATKRTPKQ